MENNIRTYEKSILQAMDDIADRSENQITKTLVDLFKSAVLKKYNEEYHKKLAEGKVDKDLVEDAVDFYFSEACVSFRQLPGMTDDFKDNQIAIAKQLLPSFKEYVCITLSNNGVEIVCR